MLDRIRDIPGKPLDLGAYHALRREESDHLTGPIWKLERSQYFHEPDDDPSWQAFNAIRVLNAEQVRGLEHDAPLPELVVDEHAIYHVSYDADWRACGARRIDDPQITRQATEEIARLWELAEPFADYFAREVGPLMPPVR